jgi:hypothetical protein
VALGNAKPTFVCEQCNTRRTGDSTTTITGRRICAGCADRLDGAALAMLTDSLNPVGDAIAVTGWLSGMRRRRRVH